MRILMLGICLGGSSFLAAQEPSFEEQLIEPAALAAWVKSADRIEVKLNTFPGETQTLAFESSQRADIEALAAASAVESPKEWFHCMCLGEPKINLYQGDKWIGTLSNHHGGAIRAPVGNSDAVLVDPEKWLKWFDDRGIGSPRREVEEAKKLNAQAVEHKKRWLAAMPASLRLIWDQNRNELGMPDVNKLRPALVAEIPDRAAQIRALLSLYGSGEGPWSGYAMYEGAAEELLDGYSLAEIEAALDLKAATTAQLEGAARYYWMTYQTGDPHGYSRKFRAALMEHMSRSKSEDNLNYAKDVLGQ